MRVSFSRNFAHAKFRENKTIAKWRNHSVVYRCKEKHVLVASFNVANMSLTLFTSNEVCAKNSEFTVKINKCGTRQKRHFYKELILE